MKLNLQELIISRKEADELEEARIAENKKQKMLEERNEAIRKKNNLHQILDRGNIKIMFKYLVGEKIEENIFNNVSHEATYTLSSEGYLNNFYRAVKTYKWDMSERRGYDSSTSLLRKKSKMGFIEDGTLHIIYKKLQNGSFTLRGELIVGDDKLSVKEDDLKIALAKRGVGLDKDLMLIRRCVYVDNAPDHYRGDMSCVNILTPHDGNLVKDNDGLGDVYEITNANREVLGYKTVYLGNNGKGKLAASTFTAVGKFFTVYN